MLIDRIHCPKKLRDHHLQVCLLFCLIQAEQRPCVRMAGSNHHCPYVKDGYIVEASSHFRHFCRFWLEGVVGEVVLPDFIKEFIKMNRSMLRMTFVKWISNDEN